MTIYAKILEGSSFQCNKCNGDQEGKVGIFTLFSSQSILSLSYGGNIPALLVSDTTALEYNPLSERQKSGERSCQGTGAQQTSCKMPSLPFPPQRIPVEVSRSFGLVQQSKTSGNVYYWKN